MAQRSGLSHNTVSRPPQAERAFGLQPHRTEAFKLSSDPCFIEKVPDIVGLYLDPPEPGPAEPSAGAVCGREVPDPGLGPHSAATAHASGTGGTAHP